MSVLPYYLAFLVPLSVIIGFHLGGLFNFFTPIFIFGLVPLLDFLVGINRKNPSGSQMEHLEQNWSFKLVPILFVPTQIALVIWGASVIGRSDLGVVAMMGFILSVGITTGGIGITISHELCHKRNLFEQTLGKILLLSVCYMHFHIEHLQGHHRNVATRHDPATARLGESFYAFYPRTVVGSFKSAWHTEANRLKKRGCNIWSVHNQMLQFAVLPLLFAAALSLAFGWMAAIYFFMQSIIGFTLLEIVNYLEHYGLEREEISPGKFEPVCDAHSWNASNRLTNYFLFKLQRHADHHMHPLRRYQTLRHFDDSPQLPTGYTGMIVLALLPYFWRKVMDPRVHAIRQNRKKPTAQLH
ncbi:MAG: alkane 1-monooxygenase [Verrucomicrobia bacterium]|nr:alkane 1-monooxygenase [Verrucomicrobiota bacterium]